MKISIIVTARNDGYGGFLEYRAQNGLTSLIENYDEVVYVDWCSPDGISLIEEIELPYKNNFKHIKVDVSDMKKLNPDSLKIPMCEVLAKNIAFRRAKNDWIVSTSIDLLSRPPIIDDPNPNILYAVQRRNVPVNVFIEQMPTDNALNWLEETKNRYQLAPFETNLDGKETWSKIAFCGDYQLASKQLWFKMRGFEESMLWRNCMDSNVMKKAYIYGEGTEIIQGNLFHLDHRRERDSVVPFNDMQRDVVDFIQTTNDENWGFPEYNFEEEIL